MIFVFPKGSTYGCTRIRSKIEGLSKRTTSFQRTSPLAYARRSRRKRSRRRRSRRRRSRRRRKEIGVPDIIEEEPNLDTMECCVGERIVSEETKEFGCIVKKCVSIRRGVQGVTREIRRRRRRRKEARGDEERMHSEMM